MNLYESIRRNINESPEGKVNFGKQDITLPELKNNLKSKLHEKLGDLVKITDKDPYNHVDGNRNLFIIFNVDNDLWYTIEIDLQKDKYNSYKVDTYVLNLHKQNYANIESKVEIPTRGGNIDNLLNSFIDSVYDVLKCVIISVKSYSSVIKKFEDYFKQYITKKDVYNDLEVRFYLTSDYSVFFRIDFDGLRISYHAEKNMESTYNMLTLDDPSKDTDLIKAFDKVKEDCLKPEQTTLSLEKEDK